MKSPLAQADDSHQTLLGDVRRQQDAAAQLACASDDLARAVTAGAVAGALAGAVAGASAAAHVHARQQFLDAALDRGALGARDGGTAPATPVTPESSQARSPPPSSSPFGGEWARAYDASTKAYYYYDKRTLETTWTAPPGWEAYLDGVDLARDLAQTSLGGSTASPRPAEAAASSGSPPSLYARDTDIDGHEEVRQSRGGAAESKLTLCVHSQVDPRVGVALEEMNNAMCRVNDLEASITHAKRKAVLVEAEQKQKCQARLLRSALPASAPPVAQRWTLCRLRSTS